MRFASRILLADTIAETVVPEWLAIDDNVSPGFTTYVCGAAEAALTEAWPLIASAATASTHSAVVVRRFTGTQRRA
jgi:hypothetical protein